MEAVVRLRRMQELFQGVEAPTVDVREGSEEVSEEEWAHALHLWYIAWFFEGKRDEKLSDQEFLRVISRIEEGFQREGAELERQADLRPDCREAWSQATGFLLQGYGQARQYLEKREVSCLQQAYRLIERAIQRRVELTPLLAGDE